MSITSTLIQPPPSLIMTVYHMLITFLVVIMVQLCLVYTMLMGLSRNATVLLLLVTAISVVCFLKMMLTLTQLSAWSQVASKGARKVGQGKLTMSGGRESLLKEISKMGITNQSLSRWKDYEMSMASEELLNNLRVGEGKLD